MDKLNKRVSELEHRQPPARNRPTDADRLRWIEVQFHRNLLIDDGCSVIVNPAVETNPLHSRVLASVARAATRARIGANTDDQLARIAKGKTWPTSKND